MRWSAQSCGPHGVGTPAQLGIVWLCRRDRRHGKPGGLLHGSGRDWAQEWQSVKGAKAGWKAGRRLESLPHKKALPHTKSLPHKQGPVAERERKADHRHDCRCGTQDCVLHGEAGMASLAACSTGAAAIGRRGGSR